jgi:hypothetical protein
MFFFCISQLDATEVGFGKVNAMPMKVHAQLCAPI